MVGYAVPPSLEEWARLNDQADAAEQREDFVEFERLGPLIQEAWESAPFRDRVHVDWELLKQVWRDRHLSL